MLINYLLTRQQRAQARRELERLLTKEGAMEYIENRATLMDHKLLITHDPKSVEELKKILKEDNLLNHLQDKLRGSLETQLFQIYTDRQIIARRIHKVEQKHPDVVQVYENWYVLDSEEHNCRIIGLTH